MFAMAEIFSGDEILQNFPLRLINMSRTHKQKGNYVSHRSEALTKE